MERAAGMGAEQMTGQQQEAAGQAGAYYSAPGADLLGNAGTLAPGEREQRYSPYLEKLRLDH